MCCCSSDEDMRYYNACPHAVRNMLHKLFLQYFFVFIAVRRTVRTCCITMETLLNIHYKQILNIHLAGYAKYKCYTLITVKSC